MTHRLRMIVLWISVLLLGITLFVRLGDEAHLTTTFPTDYTNDISAYMAQLHFLDVCGYQQQCPYWYNGFVTFRFTPPGWYFFAYPLLLLFIDVKIATYAAILLSLLLGLLVVWHGGKKLHLSSLERLFFFLFFAANANAIRGFLRTGRPHELLAWVFFFGLFFMLLYYKDKKITWHFYFASLLYALCIFTYVAVGVFASLFLAGLFFLKRGREKSHVIGATLLGIALTSFWTLPYLLHIKESSLLDTQQATWLLQFTPDLLLKQLGGILFPLFFLFLFYLLWSRERSSKELFFFLPALILAVLFVLRLNVFLPVFRDIFPSPYFNFFLTLSGYFYLKVRGDFFIHKLTHATVLAGIILSCVLSLFFTSYFAAPTQQGQDLLDFVPQITDTYLLADLPPEVYSKAVLAYATIYYNKTTSFGYYQHMKNSAYLHEVSLALHAADTNDCALLKKQMETLHTSEFLTSTSCDFLSSCGLNLKSAYKDYCLYTTKEA